MKRRITAGILAFLFLFTSVSILTGDNAVAAESLVDRLQKITLQMEDEAVKKYTDVGNHWSKKYAAKLIILGIMGGYSDGTLKLDKNVNVDEFLTMTVKALGLNPQAGTGYWAEPYIKAAKEKKLIDEGEFKTYSRAITREEMAKIIVKAALLSDAAPDTNLISYIKTKVKDYSSINDKYKQFVLQGYALGLFGGSNDGKFNPKGVLKRSEASVVELKYIDKKSRVPFKLNPNEVIELSDFYGKKNLLYASPSNMDMFKTITVLNNNTSKSKGYLHVIYNPENNVAAGCFYNSKDTYKQSFESFEMTFAIDMKVTNKTDFPYSITVDSPEQVKKKHRDVIVEVFKNLFAADSNKAILQFDRFTELSLKGGKSVRETYYFNKRKVVFYTVDEALMFEMWVYNK
ncbi:MAG: S-layer homology domain-containing protein [Clostridia bacterium]|nr:S-layer homology domain-containing protein [Clostridia bacterium]